MTTPDLDKLLGQLGTGGWRDLENMEAEQEKQAKEAREKAREKALVFEAAFSTRAGKEVLEWLLGVTIYRPSWAGNSFNSLDKITGYGLYREGQNSIAWTILEALATARGEQPPGGNHGGV